MSRRAATAGVVLSALLMLAGCTAAPAPGHSPAVASASPTSSPSPSSAAGTVVRSFDVVPANATLIATAATGVLYTAVASGDADRDWRISRLDGATGAVVSRMVDLPQLRSLTVGPSGLYLSTSVIEKFGAKPDTIVRLDARNLTTLAKRGLEDHALFDGSVHLAASGSLLAEMDGGGAIRLLDPETLATERSTQVLSVEDQRAGDDVESPVIRNGRLWVLAHHDVLAYSLPTLRQEVSTPEEQYSAILGTSAGLVLAGDRLARLTNDGHVSAMTAVAGLDGTNAGVQSAFAMDGLIAEQPSELSPPIVLRRATDGTVVGERTLAGGDGSLVGAAGDLLWAQGVTGNGWPVTAIRVGGTALTAAPACHAGALRVTATRMGGALGTDYGDLDVENASATACSLHGPVSGRVLGSDGEPVGAAAGSTAWGAEDPTVVLAAHGGRAFVRVAMVNLAGYARRDGTYYPTCGHALVGTAWSLSLLGVGAAIRVPLPVAHDVCSNPRTAGTSISQVLAAPTVHP